jgi:hypothetical protein
MLSCPESHGEQYAMRFADQSVVDRYHLRPTYPPETVKILNTLIRDEPRAVQGAGLRDRQYLPSPGRICRTH